MSGVPVEAAPALNALARPGATITPERALGLWLSGFRSQNTRAAYRAEIKAFAEFAAYGNVERAIAEFLALEDGPAHAVADAWRQSKINDKKSASTVNRSMAALNSFVRAARRVGATKLRLEAKGELSVSYRDTKGPGAVNVGKMIKAASEHKGGLKAARDVAILKLAFHCGLRRGEIVSLDVGHADLAGGTVSILGKGRTQRVPLTIPLPVCDALEAWCRARGETQPSDPLFIDLSTSSKGARLSGCGVYHIIQKIGKDLGIKVRPHGLRHSAITTALDAFNGDFRKVKQFSRHKSLDTVEKYDDNRADHAGQVSAALCAIVE